MKKVVIIGAGPAGITAGYELVKKSKDYEVVILEQSNQVGGIAKTVEYNGNRMDLGGHRFFSNSEEVKNWWEEILSKQGQPAYDDRKLKRFVQTSPGGPDPEFEDEVMLVRKRISSIYFNEKFFEYPVKINSNTIKNMGLGQTAKAGFSYLESSIFKKKEDNLEGFYLNHYGKQLYQTFFEGYTEKLWGRHPSQISADWGNQRMKGLTISSILKDTSNRKKHQGPSDADSSQAEDFLYPKFGPGQIWEIAAKKFEEKGGKILFGCQAKGIETANNVIKGVTYVKDGEEVSIDADIVISSMPVKDLIAGLKHVPFNVEDAAKGLPYRDLVVLGILVPSLKIQNTTKIKTLNNLVPECWIYVQDTTVKLGRIQIYNNWSPYLVSNPDETVWIGLEYFCNEGDYYWNQSDIQWQTLAVSELVKMGIIDDPPKILDFHKEMVKKAYPAYFDTYARFDEIRTYLDNYPNLYCIGRNGQHRYNNMDHVMMTAFETVRTILAGKTDKTKVWSINMSAEYHASPTYQSQTLDPAKPIIYVEGAADNKAPEQKDPLGEAVAAAKEAENKKKNFNPMMSIRDRLSRRSVGKPKTPNSAVNYALLSDSNDTERNSYRGAVVPVRSNYQDPGISPTTSSQPPVRRKPSGVHNNATMPEDTYVVRSAPVKKESPAVKAEAANNAENIKKSIKETELPVQDIKETVVPPVAVEEPAYIEPVVEEPAYVEPIAEEPAYVEPIAEEPAYVEPVVEEPAYVEPVAEEPAYVEPVVEEPAYVEPVAEEPAYVEPVAEEPAYVEPVVEEPAYVEPVVEEPAYVEPVVEEPAYVEPVVEEPAYVEPVVEEPAYVEPVAEEPAYVEPVVEETPAETPVSYVVGSAKFNPAEKNDKPVETQSTPTLFTPRYFREEPPLEEFKVEDTSQTAFVDPFAQPAQTAQSYPQTGYTDQAYSADAYAGQSYDGTYGYGDDQGYDAGYYDDFASRNEEYDTTYSGEYAPGYGNTYETPVYDESSYPQPVVKEEETAPAIEVDGAVQKSNDFGNLFAMPTEEETKGKRSSFDTPFVPVAPTITIGPKKEDKKEFLNQTSAAYTMEKVEKVLKTEITIKPKKAQEEENTEIMVVSVPRPSYHKAKGVFTPKPITEEEKAKIEEEERAKRPIAPSINFKKKEEEPEKEEPRKSSRQRPRKKNFVRPTVPITADWETMNAKTLRELPEMVAKKEEEEPVVKVQKSDLPMYDIYAEMSYDNKEESTSEADAAIAASLQTAALKEAKAQEEKEAREAAAAAAAAYAEEVAKAEKASAEAAKAAEQEEIKAALESEAENGPALAAQPAKKKNIADIEVPKDLFANARVIAVIKNGVKTSTTGESTSTQTVQPVKKTIQKYTSDFETTTVKSIRKLRAKRQEEAIQSITRMLEGTDERKVVSPRPRQTAENTAKETAPSVPKSESVADTTVAPTPVVQSAPVAEPEPVVASAPAVEPAPVPRQEEAVTAPETPATEEATVNETETESAFGLDLRLKDGSYRSIHNFSLNASKKVKPEPAEEPAVEAAVEEPAVETVTEEPVAEAAVEAAVAETIVEDVVAAVEEPAVETVAEEPVAEVTAEPVAETAEPVFETDLTDNVEKTIREDSLIEESLATALEEPAAEPVAVAEEKAPEEAAPEDVVVVAPEPPKKRTRKTTKTAAETGAEGTEAEDGTVKKTRKTRSKKSVETDGQITIEGLKNLPASDGSTAEAPAEEAPKPKRTYRKRTPKAEADVTAEGADAVVSETADGEAEKPVKKTTRKPRAKKTEENPEVKTEENPEEKPEE